MRRKAVAFICRAIKAGDSPVIVEKPAYPRQQLADPSSRRIGGIAGYAEETGAVIIEQPAPPGQLGQRSGTCVMVRAAHEEHEHVAARRSVENEVLIAIEGGRREPRHSVAR